MECSNLSCEATFVPRVGGGRPQLYCSPVCRKNVASRRNGSPEGSLGLVRGEKYQRDCIHCGDVFSYEYTGRARQQTCSSCKALSQKLRRPGKTGFSISIGEYFKMLKKQGDVCAICGETCPRNARLSVDHCHATGKVRGLLCAPCNVGLGQFRDDADRLMQAVTYLST